MEIWKTRAIKGCKGLHPEKKWVSVESLKKDFEVLKNHIKIIRKDYAGLSLVTASLLEFEERFSERYNVKEA